MVETVTARDPAPAWIARLPNQLTLGRILVLPLIVALVLVDGPLAAWGAVVLFGLAGITDYFDGAVARRWNCGTAFGRCFDPIADKLLVVSVLVALVAASRLSVWALIPILVILCREVLVSGLREYLAADHVAMPVTKLAKWKTAAQLAAIGLLLGAGALPWLAVPGEVMLWVAAALTAQTGAGYVSVALAHVGAEGLHGPGGAPSAP